MENSLAGIKAIGTKTQLGSNFLPDFTQGDYSEIPALEDAFKRCADILCSYCVRHVEKCNLSKMPLRP